MKCPHCEFTSDELWCPQCGERSEAAELDELSHLEYLDTILDSWLHEGLVSRLRSMIATRLTELREAAASAEAADKELPLPTAAPDEPRATSYIPETGLPVEDAPADGPPPPRSPTG